MNKTNKILITGAAGLVGQNLIVLLEEAGYTNIVAVDKHEGNSEILRKLHPAVRVYVADVGQPSGPGGWAEELEGTTCLAQLHAQITGKSEDPFITNNIEATKNVLALAKTASIPYIVHISSSTVNSVAHDWYSESKREQERLVRESGISHCVLRPTLMFGWFDPKHLGWLSRFMGRVPVFPIPGDGRFLRQPLYARDFCRVIMSCLETKPEGAVYDIVGQEEIFYIDMIRRIKELTAARAVVVKIPFALFNLLLRAYALVSSKPPFTAHQLKALAAGDYFVGVDIKRDFGLVPTPLSQALRETFCDPRFSQIILEQTT